MGVVKNYAIPLLGKQMMPYSIYQNEWIGEQGMTNPGFGIWTAGQLECVWDYKYKNKSTIAA